MKKINSITFIVAAILFASCGQKHNIEANIEGLGNDTLLISYRALNAPFSERSKEDTIVSVDGKFSYDIPVDEPVSLTMYPKKGDFKYHPGAFYAIHKNIKLTVKPDEKIKLSGKMEKYYIDYDVKGSELMKEYCAFRKEHIGLLQQAYKSRADLDSMRVTGTGDKEKKSSLGNEYRRLFKALSDTCVDFMKNNPDKEVVGMLYGEINFSQLGIYEELGMKVRNGIFKNRLEQLYIIYLKNKKSNEAESNIVEGKKAPDFTLKTLSGDDFNLYTSLPGKYIVLDFWGSWCGWCIKGFPDMKEYYKQHSDKLEIVSIACRDTEEKWKKAVKENGLEWTNLINAEAVDKDVSVMYGVKGYPTKIVLDKEKKILINFVGDSDDFYKKLDEVLKAN